MSAFEVKVYPVKIESHPNADQLELAKIGEYYSIVKKGQFVTGDLVAYIPEGSIVPVDVIQHLGLEGRLAGKDKNRVKAIRLRQVLSQGLIYPIDHSSTIHRYKDGEHTSKTVEVDDDVAEFLGIFKYAPVVPVSMAGNVYSAGLECTINYDIENWKKYPNTFAEGEEVVMAEKIHGTCFQFGIVNAQYQNENHKDGVYLVASKGLGARGLPFKHDDEYNQQNVYLKAAAKYNLYDIVKVDDALAMPSPMFILGEVYGNGVQDLKYGCGDGEVKLRIFDVCIGTRGNLQFFDDKALDEFCAAHNLDRVPVLYRGPFSREIMEKYTTGKETVSGTEANIREGIVIRTTTEKYDRYVGRKQLKSVSEDYLLRKGDVTEYQ